jgi:hypothetical protein
MVIAPDNPTSSFKNSGKDSAAAIFYGTTMMHHSIQVRCYDVGGISSL